MLDLKLWRWIGTIVLTALSIYFLVPTLVAKDANGNPQLPSWWKGTLTERTLNLGLDLQGGMHVDLAVDTEAAVRNRLVFTGESMVDLLKKQNVQAEAEIEGGEIVVSTTAEGQRQLRDIAADQYPTLDVVSSDPGAVRFALKEVARRDLRDLAVRQALDTIRNRIDQFGVREADVVRKGDDRIVVQLPGIQDPQRALDLIQSTAQLEFRLVETMVASSTLDQWVRQAYQQEPTLQTAPTAPKNVARLNELLAGQLPRGTMVLFGRFEGGRRVAYLVQDKPLLTGDAIDNAEVAINTQYNEPYVSLNFNSEGADRFADITGANVGRNLAIVLDNTVRSAPTIREAIPGGQAQISGAFTMDEARDLAIALRSGALPAPVELAEKRLVGPTLGADSIRAGITSVLIAAAAIFIFMVVYYSLAGIVADLALLLNILFILGLLSMFEATLTLPGIAGIVLTIGMAIDANILIFERMREELRLGKSSRSALEAGYAKALWTIIDAQVTGLVAAVVLFQFGTGPIKGFAVTLTIGLLSSIFTAVVVSKMIFEQWVGRRGNRKIPVGITVPASTGK